MTALAVESAALLRELILDRVAKGLIVVAAVVVLARGTAVIWRRVGRKR